MQRTALQTKCLHARRVQHAVEGLAQVKVAQRIKVPSISSTILRLSSRYIRHLAPGFSAQNRSTKYDSTCLEASASRCNPTVFLRLPSMLLHEICPNCQRPRKEESQSGLSPHLPDVCVVNRLGHHPSRFFMFSIAFPCCFSYLSIFCPSSRLSHPLWGGMAKAISPRGPLGEMALVILVGRAWPKAISRFGHRRWGEGGGGWPKPSPPGHPCDFLDVVYNFQVSKTVHKTKKYLL